METIRRKIGRRETHHFHIPVLDPGSHCNVVGGNDHIHSRSGVSAASRLQSAINRKAYDRPQCQGDEADHQEPGAIHELLLKAEIEALPAQCQATERRCRAHETLLPILGAVTIRFAGTEPYPGSTHAAFLPRETI